jgi:hypothetical protein
MQRSGAPTDAPRLTRWEFEIGFAQLRRQGPGTRRSRPLARRRARWTPARGMLAPEPDQKRADACSDAGSEKRVEPAMVGATVRRRAPLRLGRSSSAQAPEPRSDARTSRRRRGGANSVRPRPSLSEASGQPRTAQPRGRSAGWTTPPRSARTVFGSPQRPTRSPPPGSADRSRPIVLTTALLVRGDRALPELRAALLGDRARTSKLRIRHALAPGPDLPSGTGRAPRRADGDRLGPLAKCARLPRARTRIPRARLRAAAGAGRPRASRVPALPRPPSQPRALRRGALSSGPQARAVTANSAMPHDGVT